MFSVQKAVRSAIKHLLFWCAVLWLVVEALLVLIATFHLPNELQLYLTACAAKPGISGLVGRLITEGWPAIAVAFLMLTWQELRRWGKQWFKTTKGHERAHLLIVSWFVFLGTLFVVDYLSDVTVVLPTGAHETSVILAYAIVASWCSRIAHWIKRQCERRRITERRPPREAPKGIPHPGTKNGKRRNSNNAKRPGISHAA